MLLKILSSFFFSLLVIDLMITCQLPLARQARRANLAGSMHLKDLLLNGAIRATL